VTASSDTQPALPAGWRLLHLAEVGSTNAEAQRLGAQGEPDRLWIWADAQVTGRGQGGRGWVSPPGNLYASLLLRLAQPIAIVQQLALLAPVAAHDAVAELLLDRLRAKLRLKWPNDLMLDGAKLAGILLESSGDSGCEPLTLVIGTGINLAHHPQSIDQPATDLARHGVAARPAAAMAALAAATAHWLAIWDEGRGFHRVRAAWLERAGPVGTAITVRQGEQRQAGRFAGLDDTGALLLDLPTGERRRYAYGRVALGAEER
jgi:BirA family biotin operon repressor/biotin-[acetyl-CoA-carboxylase] ligase